MPGSRKAEIRKQTRLFNDFFKIDEVMVTHEQRDGTMSPEERRLVFERGDSVAIILYSADTKSVIVVDQFKVPSLIGRRRDDPSSMDGWIIEAVAGMIDPGETAEAAIVRETEEETGYRITNPRLICKFFSSPGGTSERIFVYFAEVHESDKVGEGGGLPGEDITVVSIPLDALYDRLAKGLIEDPKLAIGAYWLIDYLKARADGMRLVESMQLTLEDLFQRLEKGSIENAKLAEAARWLEDHLISSANGKSPLAGLAPAKPAASQPARSGPLPSSTVRYELKDRPGVIVGYKTGDIELVKDVSLWVNSENTDMMMARFLDRSISATIRYLGSNRDEQGNVLDDTINEALRNAVGPRGHVKIGTVLVTESGTLKSSNNVQRILHVATVEGGPRRRLKADPDRLPECVKAVLDRGEQENRTVGKISWNLLSQYVLMGRFKVKDCESIIMPLFGAGDGGLQLDDVTRLVIPAAIEHLRNVRRPLLKEVYFLAYAANHKAACECVLEQYCADGTLVRMADAS